MQIARVIIYRIGGEVTWSSEGEVDVIYKDYDAAENHAVAVAAIERLAGDLEHGDRWRGLFPN